MVKPRGLGIQCESAQGRPKRGVKKGPVAAPGLYFTGIGEKGLKTH